MERVMYALDFLGKLRIWVGIGGVVVVMVVRGDRKVTSSRKKHHYGGRVGVGVSGRPILRCPRSPFPHPNTYNFAEIEGRGAGRQEKKSGVGG